MRCNWEWSTCDNFILHVLEKFTLQNKNTQEELQWPLVSRISKNSTMRCNWEWLACDNFACWKNSHNNKYTGGALWLLQFHLPLVPAQEGRRWRYWEPIWRGIQRCCWNVRKHTKLHCLRNCSYHNYGRIPTVLVLRGVQISSWLLSKSVMEIIAVFYICEICKNRKRHIFKYVRNKWRRLEKNKKKNLYNKWDNQMITRR